MTHQIFDVSWGRCTYCINILIHVDPISNHTSRVSLNRRCTIFSVRNTVVSVAKTKQNSKPFFALRKSAKSLWEFEVGRKHALDPKKVVDAGQNQ